MQKQIKLTQEKVAIIDDADFDLISKFKWSAVQDSTGLYRPQRNAYINGKRRTIYMHQDILSAPDGFVVDHINNNPLDNRRCNLRIATNQQNAFNARCYNKRGFKGVTWFEKARKFQSRICKGGKSHFLGYFEKIEDAAKAYDRKAIELFGEFANLNFPKEV